MKKKSVFKTLAINIAISFFFVAIFVLLYYVFISNRIVRLTSLINTTVIKGDMGEAELDYDKEAKRIIKYPLYGKKYATLKIPAIKLSLPLYNGDSMDILRYGAGQYVGSFFPGEGKFSLIAAHNNAGFFQKLPELKEKDKIIIEANYGTFTYELEKHMIVNKNQEEYFMPEFTDDKERIILYTCYPIYGGAIGRKTERYVVYATRVED